MSDGSGGTLLARSLVGRDGELPLAPGRVARRRHGAGRDRGGRGGQEPARPRAGVVGADRRRARADRTLQPDRAGHAAATVARGAPRRGPRRPPPRRRPRCLRARPGAGRAGVGRRRRRPLGRSCWARRCCGCCRRGRRRAPPPCSWSRTSTGPTPSRSPCSSTWSTTWPARRCSWSPPSATASPARAPTWPPT